jgi:SAM-dependent methyltransferase
VSHPAGEPRRVHWERVYTDKKADEVSWYQPRPATSLELIRATGAALDAPFLDVGAGASTLVDNLIETGYSDITLLDIAGAALATSRARLGAKAVGVEWIEADVMQLEPPRRYSVWHDRAVFHFLVDAGDRDRYLEVLRKGIAPEGHFIIATFGPEGPLRCSGLDVHRYTLDELAGLLEPYFSLRRSELEQHRTPAGGVQQFLYAWWQARAPEPVT